MLFARVGSDTRRPASEITLWEGGHTVGALYKAALAGALLGFQPQANNLRWRLLSVRFNGLTFFAEVGRLPDLQARQKLLTDALDRVRELVEVTYPLGTEVYRDEDGSVFVVPGCDKANCSLDILTLQDGGRTLHDCILEQVRSALAGEVVPVIKIDSEPWWGQDPQRRGNDEGPPVAQHLQPIVTSPDPEWVEHQWNSGELSEICTVCGLRPQGPSQKAKDRHVCNVCEERRTDRSREWVLEKLHTTIWTDEVADANGRLALVVGCFDLTHWLSGDLVYTLAVREPNDQNGRTYEQVGKNPSFARLRRIWETTRTFWQEVAPTDDDKGIATSLMGQSVGQTGPRLEIRGDLRPASPEDTPGPYHTYELILPRGVKLSAVWDEKSQRFITCDNLEYLAGEGQLGKPGEPVYLLGYVFEKQDLTLPWQDAFKRLQLGGERTYGWGMVTVEEVRPIDDYRLFQKYIFDGNARRPLVILNQGQHLLAHTKAVGLDEAVQGNIEPLVGREWVDSPGDHLSRAEVCFVPGAEVQNDCLRFTVEAYGLWEKAL